MRINRLYGLSLLLLLSSQSLISASSTTNLLTRLSKVESNHNDFAVGSKGEISRYQFLPYVWHSYSLSKAYTNKETATAVANKHIQWIRKSWPLERAITDNDIIVIWNKGLTGYKRQGYRPTASDKRRINKSL